jgi:purine-nucleoside phosphorylase
MIQETVCSSLLIAAFPPDLAGVNSHSHPGWNVSCTGVGAVTAAVNTALLIARMAPRRVVFVGTCGAYDDRLAVGDFLAASEALSVSLDEVEGRAYRPQIERVRWPSTLRGTKVLGFPAHTVAVPQAVTKTAGGARLLAPLAAAEHLELTGVFAACHEAQVPCGAFLGVSNHVGPTPTRNGRRTTGKSAWRSWKP